MLYDKQFNAGILGRRHNAGNKELGLADTYISAPFLHFICIIPNTEQYVRLSSMYICYSDMTEHTHREQYCDLGRTLVYTGEKPAVASYSTLTPCVDIPPAP